MDCLSFMYRFPTRVFLFTFVDNRRYYPVSERARTITVLATSLLYHNSIPLPHCLFPPGLLPQEVEGTVKDRTPPTSPIPPALCEESEELRKDWLAACQPCSSNEIERLLLYEEHKHQCRELFLGHKESCPVCQSLRVRAQQRKPSLFDRLGVAFTGRTHGRADEGGTP